MRATLTVVLIALPVLLAGQGGASTESSQGPPAIVTFSRDIAPILSEHCWSCHRPNGAGPFSLLTYQEARRRATQIADVTARRVMPPWKPEPGYGEFVGERRLTPNQIQLIQAWVDQGTVEGDPAGAPPAPASRDRWQLGQPDLVVEFPQAYILRASGADVLRNFVVPLPVASRRYVRGIEFLPGSANVIHHATLRVDRSKAAQQLDDEDAEPGYEGIFPPSARYPDGHFLAWTPGQQRPLAGESAWPLEPDTSLVVQLHLRPTGKPETVSPSIGLFLTDTPPSRVPFTIRLSRQHIDIPAGEKRYVVEDRYVLPVDVELHEIQPHAHYLAREVQGLARLPDGTSQWLVYIRDWDFNWQNVYRFLEPLSLPKGTELLMRYSYDNSKDNIRNPSQPPRRVTWGQNSTDEMAELWLQVFPRTQQELALLDRDFQPKMIGEDLVGFRNMLSSEPNNPRLHEAVAFCYLQLGKQDVALDHLRTSVRLDPNSAYGHYNLGTALIALGKPNEAVTSLEEAVRLRPDFAASHNNLAGVLWNLGKRDEAVAHYRQVLLIEPNHSLAHKNLAVGLAAMGKIPESLVQFRLALTHLADDRELLQQMAWILAAHPDSQIRAPQEAIRLAERAADLTARQNPRVLDLLAVAYSAASQFDRAIPIARSALSLAIEARADSLASEIRSRLRLYEEGKPYLFDFSRTINLDVR